MKDNDEKTIAIINNFLKKMKISGIIDIGGIGTFSMYKDYGAKLRVLDEAKTEIYKHEYIKQESIKFDVGNIMDEESSNPIKNRKKLTKTGNKKYIG